MAQAARLSLRMQKELKLLLSDPPPGASFPLLSADSDLFSLSSIDARKSYCCKIFHFQFRIPQIFDFWGLILVVGLSEIEGPEETVYAKGIFHIKIQIPERFVKIRPKPGWFLIFAHLGFPFPLPLPLGQLLKKKKCSFGVLFYWQFVVIAGTHFSLQVLHLPHPSTTLTSTMEAEFVLTFLIFPQRWLLFLFFVIAC